MENKNIVHVEGIIRFEKVNIAENGKKPNYLNEEVRDILVNGKKLNPADSLKIVNHSPDGFGWGYGGSAPCQCALAILLETKGREFALDNQQALKWNVLAKQNIDSDFDIWVDIEQLVQVDAPAQ